MKIQRCKNLTCHISHAFRGRDPPCWNVGLAANKNQTTSPTPICRLIPRHAQNTDIRQPHRSDSISSRNPPEQDPTTNPSQPLPLQWKSQWPSAIIHPPQNTKQIPFPLHHPPNTHKHVNHTPTPNHRTSNRPNRPPSLRLAILRRPNDRHRPHLPTLHRTIRHREFRPLHPRSRLHFHSRLPARVKIQPTRDTARGDDGRAVRIGVRRGGRILGQRRGGGTDGVEPGVDIYQ